MLALKAGMSWRRFSVLLVGLSPDSMWRRVATSQPIELSGESARSFINTL